MSNVELRNSIDFILSFKMTERSDIHQSSFFIRHSSFHQGLL